MISILSKFSHVIPRDLNDPFIYSVPVNSNSSDPKVGLIEGNETAARRKPGFQYGQLDSITKTQYNKTLKTLQEAVINTEKSFGDQEFVFQRDSTGKYGKGQTYNEIIGKARNLASGILNLELSPKVKEFQNFELQMIGVHAKNRHEWAIIDFAAMLYGFTVVPLYDTLGEEALSYCVDHSGMYNMFASSQSVDILLKASNLGRIQTIVAFDPITPEQQKNGDVQKLKDDLADVQPQFFASVPRLYLRFYDAIKAKLDGLTGLKKTLLEKGFQTKQQYLKRGHYYRHAFWDKLLFNKIKNVFGGQIKAMLTASAPISPDVLEFLKIVACCPIFEAYGQTESSGGSFCTSQNDSTTGHVGGPTCSTEFKLQSVPELDYQVSDCQDGIPMPRGEICMRGPCVFLGYYKDEEKTKEAIDDQGWLHSGDVGMLLPNGALKIIDRKKNIFKLSQGEYVAPEKIENVYKQAQGIGEIFVYGNSLQSCLVGLVVPSPEFVEKYLKENNISGKSIEELCKDKQFEKQIVDNMEIQAKKDKLMGFEKVRKVLLEPVSLMLHGCLTNTFKLQRAQATKMFKERLEALYN